MARRFLERLRGLLRDRRKDSKPVEQERRADDKRSRQKQVDDRLADAIDELDRTVRLRRDDLLKMVAVNDAQQVVIFSTYREICESKGPEIGGMRLCRDSRHPHANDGSVQICDERLCPRLWAALKGAA